MVKIEEIATEKKDTGEMEHSSPSIPSRVFCRQRGQAGRKATGVDSCGIVGTMLECFMRD